MKSIQSKYYIKGVDNQKRPDITFNFKRVDLSKLQKLPAEDRVKIIDFIISCQDMLEQTILSLDNNYELPIKL